MAGVGKGRPRKAGASRPDQRKAVKVLVDRSEAAVPPLPEPEAVSYTHLTLPTKA